MLPWFVPALCLYCLVAGMVFLLPLGFFVHIALYKCCNIYRFVTKRKNSVVIPSLFIASIITSGISWLFSYGIELASVLFSIVFLTSLFTLLILAISKSAQNDNDIIDVRWKEKEIVSYWNTLSFYMAIFPLFILNVFGKGEENIQKLTLVFTVLCLTISIAILRECCEKVWKHIRDLEQKGCAGYGHKKLP